MGLLAVLTASFYATAAESNDPGQVPGRIVLSLSAPAAAVALVAISFAPESPRLTLSKGHISEALDCAQDLFEGEALNQFNKQATTMVMKGNGVDHPFAGCGRFCNGGVVLQLLVVLFLRLANAL